MTPLTDGQQPSGGAQGKAEGGVERFYAFNEIMPVTECVRAIDFDRLQSALAEAQRSYAEGLEAWRVNNAHHAAEIDRMRSKLLELAGECAECLGNGMAMSTSGVIEHVRCDACKDIWDAAGVDPMKEGP